MRLWFKTLDDSLWLRPDEGGEAEAEFVRRALKLERGQRVLDAPCGAGRVSLPLARAGVAVTGVDLRASFIERARRASSREGLKVDLRVADLRAIELPEQYFHGVLSWFNSFGYFSDKENLALLARLAASLRPGGRLLIDQLNRERILRRFREEKVDGQITYRARWDSKAERLEIGREINGVDAPENRSSQRLYTLGQMTRLIQEVGLTMAHAYGAMDLKPYLRGSPQMIVVARRG